MSIIGVPRETQYQIFSYLSFRELMASRTLSREYNQVVDGYLLDVWERIKNIPAGDSACSFKNLAEAIEDKSHDKPITELFRKLFTKWEVSQGLRFNRDNSMNVERFIQLQKIHNDVVDSFSFCQLVTLRQVSEEHEANVDFILCNLWNRIRVMPPVPNTQTVTHLRMIAEEVEKNARQSEDISIIALFRCFFARYQECSMQALNDNQFVMRIKSFEELQEKLVYNDRIAGCSIS